MKLVNALVFSVICLVVVSLFAVPVSAWWWPVFGFSGPGLGFPAYDASAVAAPQPGTPEWGLSPVSHAVPVLPGYPYYGKYPFHGSINFGSFGYGSPGLSFPVSTDSGPEGILKT